MLLRRVMENLQNQNWLAVILDFFIVVLGVVAAFQLQTWGETRAADQRAKQSLHQLYGESEEVLAAWIRQVTQNNETLEVQDRVIAALSTGDRSSVSDKELVQGIATMSHFATISPPRRVYDELRSAGLLREIKAPEALAATSDYYERLAFVQGQIEFFRPSVEEYDFRLGAGVNSVYDPTSLTRRTIEIDFETLAADPQYIDTLVGLLRNRLVFQFYRRGVLERAAIMCAALAKAIGEPCQGYSAYEEMKEMPQWQVQNVPPRE